jgi:hypothetical protein
MLKGKPDRGKRRPRKNGPQLQRAQHRKLDARGNAGFTRGKVLFAVTLPSGEVISAMLPAKNRRGSKYAGGMM